MSIQRAKYSTNITPEINAVIKQLDEKKSLLVEKNAELSELNCRLEVIGGNVTALKKLNKNEISLQTSRELENERKNLAVEERKSDFLKEINFKNNNLTVSVNANIVHLDKIDNLIKCMLDVSNKTYSRVSLCFEKSKHNSSELDERIKQQIDKVKQALFVSTETMITQNLIDQINSKLNETSHFENVTKFILVDNFDKKEMQKYEKTNGTNIALLYQYHEGFLVLRPSEMANTSAFDQTHEIINNLLCEELLEDVCKIKYNQISGTDINETELNKLYDTLKEIKRKFLNNSSDDVDKLFLKHIKFRAKQNVAETLLDSQLTLLTNLYDDLQDYTTEKESIKSGIQLFKEVYVKRMETMLFEQCEKRKKKAELNIKCEFQEGNNLQKEIQKKQSEIENLDKYIGKKQNDLNKKNKEIDKKKEQLKVLIESKKKQDDEIVQELKFLREDLRNKESNYKLIQGQGQESKKEAEKLKVEIDKINNQIKELNENKENLEKKRVELLGKIEATSKDRDSIQREKTKFEEEKRFKEKEVNECNKEIVNITLLVEFIEKVYAKFLNNQELFKRRAIISKQFSESKNMLDMYETLIREKELNELANDNIAKLAKENLAKRREILEKSLKNILAEPSLLSYRDKSDKTVLEISGINLNYEEVEASIRSFIDKELKKCNFLYFAEDPETKNLYLTINNDKLKFEEFLKENNQIIPEIKNLTERHIKTKFLIKKESKVVKNNEKTIEKLTVKSKVAEYDENKIFKHFAELGEMNAKYVFEKLKLCYGKILRCFAGTIKIIAGNNVYLNKKNLELHGINIGIVAYQDIVLPNDFQIDTSGFDGVKFEKYSAYSNADVAKKKEPGQSGDDGYDGFSGDNGGHIYIKAERQIKNINKISEIKFNGGKGAEG
jgi:hypothetical protein